MLHGSHLEDALISRSAPDPPSKAPTDPRILMTVSDVAKAAQVSEWTVRAEIKRGNLAAKRIGRLTRITQGSYANWVGGM
jgi:hypothetical protein